MKSISKVCDVEGCNSTAIRRSLCSAHYHRLVRYGLPCGKPSPKLRRSRPVCSIDGCENFQNAHGLCGLHEMRKKRTGDPLKITRVVTAHKMSRSGTYRSWQKAKDRCYNPNNLRYADYGGNSVVMCAALKNSFIAFYKLMGDRPPYTTLDRRDAASNYSCGECSECVANGWAMNMRWADASTQSHNKRTWDRYKGIERNGSGYAARIQRKGARYYLGTFRTEDEAFRAYKNKSIELFGEENL